MQSRSIRFIILLFFLGLLAYPLVRQRLTAGPPPPPPGAAGEAEAVNRYGFMLTEVSQQAGIDFKHQAPRLDSKLDHIMTSVASMGASVSIVDYDRDDQPDFYLTNSGEGSKNRLYRNLGNGKFEEVAEKLGIADVNRPGTGVSMGAVWGDYDNDGYEDLLLYKWGKPELFHNEAGQGFKAVSAQAGLPAWVNANAAIWLDYDNDGHLDMLLCGYYDERIDLWHLKDTRMMPESFEYANNGGRKYLLHNRGDGTFEDTTERMGIKSRRWTLAAVAADLRGTGYPDIVLANDYGIAEYFANQKGQGFREIGRETGVGYQPKSGMNASVGDVLNRGEFAIYRTNISEPGILLQGNDLWVPDAHKSGEMIHYTNVANAMGVEIGGWSFGAQFGDLNNDGTLDIYLTNGNITGEPGKGNYWYDFTKIAGGNKSIISDAANWPPLKGRSLAGEQQKCVWINDGSGKFTDVAPMVGVKDTYDGRSVALVDLGNRGALDVIVANMKGPLLVYQNRVNPENKWIGFALEGTKSNRSAIGAQARVFWNGQQQVQEVSGGSGFCAQNDRRLHFGLGKNPQIEKVQIRWPSGKIQEINAPEIGKIHKVKEPQ